MSNQTPFISLIIPTKNSQKMIVQCLNSVISQTYKNFEVIIVDGHSTDNTLELVSQFHVNIFFEEGRTRASACNVGISKAKGEIVAFTDDDCVLPENWLEKIAMHFADPELQVLGGQRFNPCRINSHANCYRRSLYAHIAAC